MSGKLIKLRGTPNFRDIGGYQNEHKETLNFGRLYRSGSLAALNADDWKVVRALNIEVVCDFRREVEYTEEPSAWAQHAPADVRHLTIDPGSIRNMFDRMHRQTGMDTLRSFTPQAMIERMQDVYRALALHHAEQYREFFQALLNLSDNAALLFHCSAGKDRTGFAAALLMMSVGVSRALIEQDYLLTTRYFLPEREMPRVLKRYGEGLNPDYVMDSFRPLLQARIEYLQAAFNEIDTHFNSIESYLDEVFGIGPQEREELRRRYCQ